MSNTDSIAGRIKKRAERTLDFRNGVLVDGLTNGTTTGDITFGGTTLKFTNGFLTTQTTVSGN